jgi:solute carrier family 45 protein 1/2/4
VIGVYLLDFAINTVQAALRTFIVDCGPAHQQEAANSMASRMTGIGNIIGYIAGYVNLTTSFWFLGDTQFKILCAVASIALGFTVILSAALIKERDPRLDGPPKKKQSIFVFFFTLFKSIKRMPPQIKRVCQVQFFGWVGFFPLLFYRSTFSPSSRRTLTCLLKRLTSCTSTRLELAHLLSSSTPLLAC